MLLAYERQCKRIYIRVYTQLPACLPASQMCTYAHSCLQPSITAKSDSGVITSIYYDSPSLACYFSRIRREEGAQLVRVRWYGAPDATGPEKLQPPPQSEVFIEIKTHHEGGCEYV